MQYKNYFNDLKKRIAHQVFIKLVLQVSTLFFCFFIFYYGMQIMKASVRGMQYDFSQSDNFDIEDASNKEQGDEEDKININTAEKEVLMTLPNIGAKKAEDIIRYRDENEFEAIDELTNVTGIGSKTYETLMDLICV